MNLIEIVFLLPIFNAKAKPSLAKLPADRQPLPQAMEAGHVTPHVTSHWSPERHDNELRHSFDTSYPPNSEYYL
jgi:hypothetical protein